MDRRRLLAAGAALFAPPGRGAQPVAEDWPCFRGPRGDGTSRETGLQLTWDGERNVAWKTALPGRGHSSPITWGDRIFAVTAIEEREERILLSLDAASGRILWQQTVLKAPLEPIHELNSYASSTPAADGERVYVSFLDRDRMFLAAYDHSGRRIWAVHPGPFESKHGYCASPVLWRNLVIVNGDHDGDSFLAALDRATGRTVWKTPRENRTRSYVTPIIREIGREPHMMLSGNRCVASYDPRTGRRQWVMDGPTEQFVASPVYDGKLLFITAGYPERHILAIRPEGRGRLDERAIAWRTRRGCAYVPSPVVVGPYFVIVSDGGFGSCFRAADGELLWTERLGGGHSASLVAAEGRVFFQSDRGVTTVVRPGPTFELLARNELGENTYASPVPHRGGWLIRGVRHLYRVAPGPGAGSR